MFPPQFLPDPLFLPTHQILCSPSHFQRENYTYLKSKKQTNPTKMKIKSKEGKTTETKNM